LRPKLHYKKGEAFEYLSVLILIFWTCSEIRFLHKERKAMFHVPSARGI
jgi:hypothetical protein